MKVLKVIIFSGILLSGLAHARFGDEDTQARFSRAIYSSVVATLAPTEALSTALPIRMTENLSNLGRAFPREFKAVREDAIDFLSTGHKSNSFDEVVRRTKSQPDGEDLSAEQIASLIIGASAF